MARNENWKEDWQVKMFNHEGVKILAFKPYNADPDDQYLKVVMAEYKNKYVTWLYNATSDSFNQGHYFGTMEGLIPEALEKALNDFNTRG
jgi:hypothetical protein